MSEQPEVTLAPPRAMDVDEAAKMASLKPRQLQRLIRQGRVPNECVAYLGRYIRIIADPFEAWLKAGGTRQRSA